MAIAGEEDIRPTPAQTSSLLDEIQDRGPQALVNDHGLWDRMIAALTVRSESTDIERAFQMLEANGVPRERAKSVANGIDVLATRFQRDESFQRMLIRDAARYRWLREEARFVEIVTNYQMFRVSGGENLDMTIDTAATP